MNGFTFWFTTGLGHILDIGAYDHFMFVCLLAVAYPLRDWRKLLILVTAFTLGHSLTLALSVTGRFHLPVPVIEFAIAASILVTAVFNLPGKKEILKPRRSLLFMTTAAFGLLHGLGFSFLLRAMLDREEEIVLPLLYFNLGIEAGQLIIVALILLISLFLTSLIQVSFKYFKLTIVCIILLIALKICAERLPAAWASFFL